MSRSPVNCSRCIEIVMDETPATKTSEDAPHQMPPMGEGLMSWGFVGVFLLPLALVILVFVPMMCSEGPLLDQQVEPPVVEHAPQKE